MGNLERTNRELARLDSELRAQRVDRAGFRARRRQLLLDFDERESTTTPGTAAAGDSTQADAAPVTGTVEAAQASKGGAKTVGMLVTAVAAFAVLVVAGLWFFGDRGGRLPAQPAPVAEPAGTGLAWPQGVADALMKSAWSESDVSEFLDRWARLSPESIHAAGEDPLIWLLRGEVEQRLRAARDSESVDPTPEAQARSEQLQRLHDAIRAQ